MSSQTQTGKEAHWILNVVFFSFTNAIDHHTAFQAVLGESHFFLEIVLHYLR